MKTTKQTLRILKLVLPLTLMACGDETTADSDADTDVDASETTDTQADTDATAEPENCFNAQDDDGDGATDCEDSDCAADPVCSDTEICDDGNDNDGDEAVDCDDSDCAASEECGCAATEADLEAGYMEQELGTASEFTGSCGGDGPEALFEFTAPQAGTWTFDSVYSEADTVLYVVDGTCGGEELGCNDDISLSEYCGPDEEVDLDDDGFVACEDPDCALASPCVEGAAENCYDDADNDDDTLVDCDDSDCSTDPGCIVQPDVTASRVAVTLEANQSVIVVVDTFDAEQSGLVVLAYSLDAPATEAGGCDDEFDNDIDAFVDCADPDCAGDAACTFTCPSEDLGSELGDVVSADTTEGSVAHFGTCGGSTGFEYLHGGRQARDFSYGWTAPADGTYTFSTEGSELDSIMYVRAGGCDGAELACNDDIDADAEIFQSAVTLELTAGTSITIFVDGFEFEEGPFTLSITAAE